MTTHASHRLRARRLGIDTHSETVVFLRKDSPVCRSEGFSSHNRVTLGAGARQVIATLYQVESDFLGRDEAGLSDATWSGLNLKEGDSITVRHTPPVGSLSLVRRRIFGHSLDEPAMQEIISDIVAGRYSAIEISSFITACAAKPLLPDEVYGLTRAMVDVGEQLHLGPAHHRRQAFGRRACRAIAPHPSSSPSPPRSASPCRKPPRAPSPRRREPRTRWRPSRRSI